MAVSNPSPSSPYSKPPSLEPRSLTPTSTAVRSYLEPVTSLDDDNLDTLKALLRITVDLRRNTSQIHRIRRGSPGAGALGTTLATLQPRLEEVVDKVTDTLKKHEDFPGMYQVSRQFPEFRDVLNGHFNDGGNDPGYNERVHLLEKLMYVAGTLRGQLELVLEQHAYWRAKLAGEKPTRLARRLNFGLAVDPATVGEEQQSVNEIALAAAHSLQGDLPSCSSDHSFKVSVSLPQELRVALAHIWEEQKFTDVDFLIDGQVIPAHKAVLASQSQYFEGMLFGSMREAAMNSVELKDVPVPAFRKVLQFAYTGFLDMENVALQDILEVSSVSDRFGFVSLKEALGDQLSQKYISLETVLLLLVHSDIYHLTQLHKACLQFVEKKANSVPVLQHSSLLHLPMDSLASVISRDTFVAPEVEILRAVQRWKEHNSKEVEEISQLLECVRLSEFSSPEQIFQEVEPTGLLDSQTILAGVRVLCKPCLEEMRPRGRKENNNNLFTKSTVDFCPNSSVYSLQSNYQQRNLHGPPQRCVADSIVLIGEGGLYYHQRPPGLSPNTVVIALDDLYIINCLSIKGYPGILDEDQMKGKSFSYEVSLSKDTKSWMKLFDYSSFACWGTQDLSFPPQAAKFVRLDVKWREDMVNQLPLQFSACCHVSELRPFSFLPSGVIAPQSERGVVTVSWTEVDAGEQQRAVAHFRQPYSTSFLRFSLECTDKSVESVDIVVSVAVMESQEHSSGGQGAGVAGFGSLLGSSFGTPGSHVRPGQTRVNTAAGGGGVGGGKSGGSLKKTLKLKEITGAPVNHPIDVHMKEKIVNYVIVDIRKKHRKDPDTTISPSSEPPVTPSAATAVTEAPSPVSLSLTPTPKTRTSGVGNSSGSGGGSAATTTTSGGSLQPRGGGGLQPRGGGGLQLGGGLGSGQQLGGGGGQQLGGAGGLQLGGGGGLQPGGGGGLQLGGGLVSGQQLGGGGGLQLGGGGGLGGGGLQLGGGLVSGQQLGGGGGLQSGGGGGLQLRGGGGLQLGTSLGGGLGTGLGGGLQLGTGVGGGLQNVRPSGVMNPPIAQAVPLAPPPSQPPQLQQGPGTALPHFKIVNVVVKSSVQ